MTITIIGTVVGRDETKSELQTLLLAQVQATRNEPGCLNYDFHVDAEDDRVFVFYENWDSQSALDTHMQMPHLEPLLSAADRLLSEPIQIRHLNMLSEIAGRCN
jgi:quinol monooxygenase YgiN